MCMPHIHKKVKKGKPYYYIREIKRVDGKPKVVNQIYLGTVDKLLTQFGQLKEEGQPTKIDSKRFGALFLAHLFEKKLNTIGIMDSIIKRGSREKGPSIGEYFFFAWANRLVAPCSKNALEEWYQHTAIQEIMPIDLSNLTSQKYWEKWDRVDERALQLAATRFFEQVRKIGHISPDALLFDTTNYFNYLDTTTESELAQRGKNKASKNHLRQIGLALMVDKTSGVPFYFRTYPGNMHDSKLFHTLIDEMFGYFAGFTKDRERKLTVVFDKGMNSEENISFFDQRQDIHFITTYSPYFAIELSFLPLSMFKALSISKNEDLKEKGKGADQILFYRTKDIFWGKERTVIITYNPRTARKKEYIFNEKMFLIRKDLLEYKRKFHARERDWCQPQKIKERYKALCKKLHVGDQYFKIEFENKKMSFKKDRSEISEAITRFGKNIIVTDHHELATEELVQYSLDRYKIERHFRQSKSPLACISPTYHWTDGKIRCHYFACIIALTVLRLIEIWVKDKGIRLSAPKVIKEMNELNTSLVWIKRRKSPYRLIDTPNETQAKILHAFGYKVVSGVLQNVN